MKSVFKAVAIVTIFSIITRTLGFFFRIFLSRKLGPEGIGIYQIAFSVMGIFATFITSGIPLSTAKLVSKYESQNDLFKRDKTVSSSLVIAVIVSILCSILILLLSPIWKLIIIDELAVKLLLLAIPSLLFSAIYAVFRGALWGQNDYFNCGLTELIEQIIRFVLSIVLLWNISSMTDATINTVLSFDITCLLSAIIVVVIYLKKSKLCFKKGEYKNIIKSASPVTAVKLTSSLVQPLTTLLIPALLVASGYTSSEAVSSFGIVMGMTFPMLFVPMAIIGSISMVLIPTISSMLSNSDYSSISYNINQSISVSIFISVLFVPLYMSVGDLIGIVLYNNLTSGIILQMSAFCIIPITLTNLTGSILNALNLEVKSFVNYLLGSIILIISLLILTPIIKVNAITVSYLISMSVISMLNIRRINKTIPNLKLNIISTTFKYSLIILPCSILGHLVANIFVEVIGNFLSAVIGGGISILFVVLLSKVFNVYDFKDIFKLLKLKRKH
ncbi:MAG: oligosaccharide flippase family protein [Clostridia bacterium]|nr:oligosaccharide flippase family protein [Clostridia bacterium]